MPRGLEHLNPALDKPEPQLEDFNDWQEGNETNSNFDDTELIASEPDRTAGLQRLLIEANGLTFLTKEERDEQETKRSVTERLYRPTRNGKILRPFLTRGHTNTFQMHGADEDRVFDEFVAEGEEWERRRARFQNLAKRFLQALLEWLKHSTEAPEIIWDDVPTTQFIGFFLSHTNQDYITDFVSQTYLPQAIWVLGSED
ncbi:hypothetical protein H2198_003780 [Neophaeococcomyces mojaviensis]|uniref:Uncharacterized protein n=1 Tax=Neophaeococcomyces mojaviensis TaxID=3383035 RepID=A0ACC3AAG8_9EURO|nr:hypothetical protein H2198_003780 [Knufia sp. JES_112]